MCVQKVRFHLIQHGTWIVLVTGAILLVLRVCVARNGSPFPCDLASHVRKSSFFQVRKIRFIGNYRFGPLKTDP